MKEKYEQYREQADRRYEQLRDELGRSDRRYQDLLATIEQNKTSVPETPMDNRLEELELQLQSERLKVEELVAILQANTRMLQKVIPELGK
jgi:chromosome segregation ATPase